MFKSAALSTAILAAALAGSMTGCHTPSGGMFSFTGGSTTYWSTESMQKSITLIDTRTNEVFFAIDIPPGKQLTIDFDEGDGDDPVYTPDLMRYEIMDKGTQMGKLHNSITVPNAASRRVDVALHVGTAYATAVPPRPLRTDEMADRPAWWTPQGGPLPSDAKKKGMYDN